MNFKIFVSIMLLVLFSEATMAQTKDASKSSGLSKMELNVFYGQTFGLDPRLVNQKIEDVNSGASRLMKKIDQTTLMGAEVLNSFLMENTMVGVRYTVQGVDTVQGIESGAINQVKIDVQDISGVVKYKFNLYNLNFNVGGTAGVSVINDLTINDEGVTTKYSSPRGFVWRGFAGLQYKISIFSLWGEAGYQQLHDKAYKNEQGLKPTSTAGEVTIDLSGPYAIAGIGLNF